MYPAQDLVTIQMQRVVHLQLIAMLNLPHQDHILFHLQNFKFK